MGPSVRTTFICLSNNATFFYRRNTVFLLYGRNAVLDFYSPCPKAPVIYSKYGETLFQQVCDIARKNIQQAQISQKTRIVNQFQLKWEILRFNQNTKIQATKLDGPYQVYEVMLKLNQLALQMLNLEIFHYSKFQSVRATFQQTMQFWYGHMQHFRPRKWRTVRKQNPRPPTTSTILTIMT